MQWLINWIKSLVPRKHRQPTPARVFIWGITRGPFAREDFDEVDLYANGIPLEAQVMLLCKVERDGVVDEEECWYVEFNDAMELVKYFDKNIEPLEVSYE